MKRGQLILSVCVIAILLAVPLASAFNLGDWISELFGKDIKFAPPKVIIPINTAYEDTIYTSKTKTVTCRDTDGGTFIGQKGSIIYNQTIVVKGKNKSVVKTSYTDKCTNKNKSVIEWYCNNITKNAKYANYNCENGCKDGACIKEMEKVAVILVKLPEENLSKEDIKQAIDNLKESLNISSYGLFDLPVFDLYGVYNLNIEDQNSSEHGPILLMADQDINFSKYSWIYIIGTHIYTSPNEAIGTSDTSWNISRFTSDKVDLVKLLSLRLDKTPEFPSKSFLHEFIHGLNIQDHANNIHTKTTPYTIPIPIINITKILQTRGRSLGEDVETQEYADCFDLMNNGIKNNHLNIIFKEKLGWVNNSLQEITNSGIYYLYSLEQNSNKPIGLVIPWPGSSDLGPNGEDLDIKYYLEYRTQINNQSISELGPQIRISMGGLANFFGIGSLLVDALADIRKFEGCQESRVGLKINKEIIDPNTGIKIETINVTSDYSIVNITFPL